MGTSNLKVLLVDDVDFFREVMRDYFQRTPVEILMARSGAEAIEVARQERPNLIYMDVAMPGLNGLETCRKMKQDPELASIPLLLIFTPVRDAGIGEVTASGCDGYLVKPFGREEFLNLGHRHLFQLERRERRVSCQMTIDFSIAGRKFQGIGADISAHGFYVEFRDELPPDKKIRFRFLLPTVSSRPIEGSGRIAWVNQGFPRCNLSLPQGFGVEILSLDAEAWEVIQAYLEKA